MPTEQEVTQQLEELGLTDDDVQEFAPGRRKRIGDCTPKELESFIALEYEKAALGYEIAALWASIHERGVLVPRHVRRQLDRLDRRAEGKKRLVDFRREVEVLEAVLNGSAR